MPVCVRGEVTAAGRIGAELGSTMMHAIVASLCQSQLLQNYRTAPENTLFLASILLSCLQSCFVENLQRSYAAVLLPEVLRFYRS